MYVKQAITYDRSKYIYMTIRPILMTPNLTNMTKITTLQALIESSMPAELKKCNGTRKKFAWKFKFAH